MAHGHHLPYDIERLIIFHSASDRPTLCSLSLASKDFNHDVNQFLWHTVWLPREQSVQLILAACEAISRIPRRAECIRKLNYGIDLDVPPLLYEAYGSPEAYYPPKVHGSPAIAMERALRALVNLEELHFNVHHFGNFKNHGNVSFSSLLDSLVQSPDWPAHHPLPSVPPVPPQLKGDHQIRAPLKIVLKQASMNTIPEPALHITPGSPRGREFFQTATAVMGGLIFLRQLLPIRPLVREVTLMHVYSGTSNVNPMHFFSDHLIEHVSFPITGLNGEGMFDSFESVSNTSLKTIQSISLRPDAVKRFMARASSVNATGVTAEEIEGLDDPSGVFCVQGMVKLIRSMDGKRDRWDLARA